MITITKAAEAYILSIFCQRLRLDHETARRVWGAIYDPQDGGLDVLRAGLNDPNHGVTAWIHELEIQVKGLPYKVKCLTHDIAALERAGVLCPEGHIPQTAEGHVARGDDLCPVCLQKGVFTRGISSIYQEVKEKTHISWVSGRPTVDFWWTDGNVAMPLTEEGVLDGQAGNNEYQDFKEALSEIPEEYLNIGVIKVLHYFRAQGENPLDAFVRLHEEPPAQLSAGQNEARFREAVNHTWEAAANPPSAAGPSGSAASPVDYRLPDNVFQAALREQLSGARRDLVFGGVEFASGGLVVHHIAFQRNPLDQLTGDLQYLYDRAREDKKPLLKWLENAQRLSRPRRAYLVFSEELQRLCGAEPWQTMSGQQLRSTLVRFFVDTESIRILGEDAGLNMARVHTDHTSPENAMFNLLCEAGRHEKQASLVEVACRDCPPLRRILKGV